MPVNTDPPFIKSPILGPSRVLTTGNTTKDGTTLTVAGHLVFTAPADGGYLEILRCKALGTNVASLMRIFYVSQGTGDPTVAADNSLFEEWNMPATTISETAVTQTVDIPIYKGIPAGGRVFAVLATTVAAGWEVTSVGGSFSV